MSRKGKRFRDEPGEHHPEALFRYVLVCQVMAWVLGGGRVCLAVLRVTSRSHHDLATGTPRRVSASTLYRWYRLFKKHDFPGLIPKQRKRATGAVSLPMKLVKFCCQEKEKDLKASIPELLRRAKETGITRDSDKIDRTTVWRTLRRMGVPTQRRKSARTRDSRRWGYPHRLDCILCDGKHFRAGATEAKRVALIFLDDATRNMLFAVVGPSESTELFLYGLYEVISRFGFMLILYLDRGPGFISLDTLHVLKNNLKIPLIHGEAAYPEGHGKVEKFNQTIKNDLLRHWRGRPDVDPSYAALEARLDHYRRTQYNPRPHESLQSMTPQECFERDAKPLTLPSSDQELRAKFVIHERRRVTNDHVVSIDSIPYEMPRGYAGAWVTLERRLLENNRIFFKHHGELIELHEVDPVKNARTRRGRLDRDGEVETHSQPMSAADLAYQRDTTPIVDCDGGFAGTRDEEEED